MFGGVVALAVVMCGCPSYEFMSEGEHWTFTTEELATDAYGGFDNSTAVLAGSEICAVAAYDQAIPDGHHVADVVDECFEPSVEGPATYDWLDATLCIRLEEAGEVTWALDPAECEATASGFEPLADRVVFQVADRSTVTAEIQQWVEEYAEESLKPASGTFPTDWMVPAGEPMRLVAGQRVNLFVQLLGEDGEPVAWREGEGVLSARTTSGTLEQADEYLSPGWIGLTLEPGAEAELVLSHGDDEWIAGTVTGVDAGDAATLEVVAALLGDDDAGSLSDPMGARAVVRDSDGNLLLGAPVEWVLEDGDLVLAPGPDPDGESLDYLPGADYLHVEDICIAPEDNFGERTATFSARLGTLSDSVTLTWIHASEAGEPDASWEKDSRCQSAAQDGCSCSAAGASSRVATLPLMGLLAFVLRRRLR